MDTTHGEHKLHTDSEPDHMADGEPDVPHESPDECLAADRRADKPAFPYTYIFALENAVNVAHICADMPWHGRHCWVAAVHDML